MDVGVKKHVGLKGRVKTEVMEKSCRHECGNEFLKRRGEERLKK